MMNGGQQQMDDAMHQSELELQRRKDQQERSIEHLEQSLRANVDFTIDHQGPDPSIGWVLLLALFYQRLLRISSLSCKRDVPPRQLPLLRLKPQSLSLTQTWDSRSCRTTKSEWRPTMLRATPNRSTLSFAILLLFCWCWPIGAWRSSHPWLTLRSSFDSIVILMMTSLQDSGSAWSTKNECSYVQRPSPLPHLLNGSPIASAVQTG